MRAFPKGEEVVSISVRVKPSNIAIVLCCRYGEVNRSCGSGDRELMARAGRCGHYRRNRAIRGEPREIGMGGGMSETPKIFVAVAALLLALAIGNPASAQKQGGTLKMYFFDSPASMSIHEEATLAAQGP